MVRRILVLGLILAVLAVYPLLAPTAHRIDRAHCDLIRAGMTPADVEAIFGVPAGAYDWAEANDLDMYRHFILAVRLHYEVAMREAELHGDEATPIRVALKHPRIRIPSVEETWTSRDGAFIVSYDEDGKVITSGRRGDVRIVAPWQRWWRWLHEHW